MKGLKVHIGHIMLWEFKQGKNAMERVKKICSVYGEGTITDQAVRNWFVKFCSGEGWTETRAIIGLWCWSFKIIGGMQCTPKYSGISRQAKHVTIHHMPSLGKDGKVSKLGVWVPHTHSEKNKADHLLIVTSLLSQQRNSPFLDEVIIGDETYDNVLLNR